MDKLAEIKKKIEEIQAKSAVSTEMRAFIELVLNVIKKSKDELTKLSEENIQVIRESIAYIEKNHENTLGVIKEEKDAMVGEFNANLTSVKQLLEEVKAIEVKDGEDGKDGEDADPEEIIPLVLERLPKPVEETGETIANKLEALKGDERLDASAIKNLPVFKGSKSGGVVARNIYQMGDVSLTNLANDDVLKWDDTNKLWVNGTGGGVGTDEKVKYDAADASAGYLSTKTVAGTGITLSEGTGGDADKLKITNSAPDQTVSITAGTNITSVTGSYPNFTINAATQTTDISGLVPYTGATSDVTLGTHALTVHNIKPDASDGLLLESSNGTDIGILGAGNTANVTWYGSHNFDTATQDTIAGFTGAGKTLGSLATATYPSLTELSYVKGVTSAIQTQLNGKQATLTPAALTKTDDTNVTLTLGGTPTTALLQATSLTLGWTGQLALSRGGTGANLSDPGANKIMAWDDTDNSVGFWTLGSNLSYDHATHTLSATGGGSPGGSDTQVQFNDGGAFGGDAGLTWDKTTDTLTIGSSGRLWVDTLNINSGGIFAFDGTGDIGGNSLSLYAGDGDEISGNAAGGGINIRAGSGAATSGGGGNIVLTAGSAIAGNSDGGDFTLIAGAASGSGAAGRFYMATNSGQGVLYIADNVFSMQVNTGLYQMSNPTGSYTADLDTSLIDTTSKTFTFPNASGTFMLTSAIGTTVQAYDADLTTWAGITPGTGVGTALAVNVGTAGAFIRNGDTITLAENTSIALDPAGSADGKWTGITIAATAGYAQTFGDLVYLDPTDSRWEKADANSASGADGDARGILGMVVVAGASDGSACTILLNGVIRADAAFPAFTINNPIYVSETAGAVTQTQPTTTDVVIRVVGSALTADEMYFNPDRIWFTHV